MNYQKIYDQLINKGLTRQLDGYVEVHHILPRSLGGDDSEDNLVKLTAKEHFVAHLLLAKIHGGKMVAAAFLMSNRKVYASRQYSFLKEEYAKHISANKERSRKISKSLKGKPKSKEHLDALLKSRANGAGWVCPDHIKEALRISMKGEGNVMYGRTHSDEARKKISDANKKNVECPHCKKVGGIAIMKRWHFNRCKEYQNEQ